MSETVIHIVGKADSLVNPGCACGGVSCVPSETVKEAVEGLQSFLKSEGFLSAKVYLADPEVAECEERMKQLADENAELLPLTVINGKVSFYSGLRKDMVAKVLKKMAVQ